MVLSATEEASLPVKHVGMTRSTSLTKAMRLLRGRRDHDGTSEVMMGRAHMGVPRAKRAGGAQAGPERL